MIVNQILFRQSPPDPLVKGASRAYGLSIAAKASLPASSDPASDDARAERSLAAERFFEYY